MKSTIPTLEDCGPHIQRFENYADSWLREHDAMPLRLKREHTFAVLNHAAGLVSDAGLSGETGRAALLAALYHDIGRFTQFVRWKTFSDARSESHGRLGVRILKAEGFLDDESPSLRKLVLAAVGLHNRHRLPSGLREPLLTVVRVVRDADKLDIFRIMACHLNSDTPSGDVVLHVRDDPAGWSAHVAACILAGNVPSYTDMVTINDFRLLLGSWFRDLHFASARRRLAFSGHVEAVLAGLPDDPALVPVLTCLRTLLAEARSAQPRAMPQK